MRSVLIPCILCLPLVACGAASTTIDGEDRGAAFFAVRAALEIPEEKKPEAQAVAAAAIPAPSSAVEIEITTGSGEDSQSLAPGDTIDFDGTYFPGPGSVDLEFALTTVSLGWRGRFLVGEQFRIDMLGGFGIDRGDTKVSSGPVSVSDSTTVGGLVVSGDFSWRPLPECGLYGQWSGFVGFRRGRSIDTSAFEGGVVVAPIPEVEVFAGWRRTRYKEDRPASDVDFTLSGPIFGVQFGF